MSPHRQFVNVMFQPWDKRSYTYHYDGADPIAVGDKVVVDTPKEGLKTVEVVSTRRMPPDYPTKPIVRRA